MVELKKPDAASLSYRDSFGKECTCFIWKDHHKNSKNEECTCKIGVNHNLKPSPHKDGDGRPCSGPFTFSVIHEGLRACNWCRREESYSPSEVIIVFKKGVSSGEAANFIMQFRVNNYAPFFIKDKSRNIAEKDGIVAVTVSIPLASGKTPEAWLAEAEKSELVWFASRVMVARFPTFSEPAPATEPRRKNRGEGSPDFPDEFQQA